jgi:hypothetical protein
LIHRVLPEAYTELFVLERTTEGRHSGAYSLSGSLPELRADQIGDARYDQHDLLAVPRDKAHLVQRVGGGGNRARPALHVTHAWPLGALLPVCDVRQAARSLRQTSDFAVTGWSRAHGWTIGNDGRPRQVGADRTDHMVCGRPTGAGPHVNGQPFGSALYMDVNGRWHRILDPRHVWSGAMRP